MIFMSKYQHITRKIEVTYVPINLVHVLSSFDVISDIQPGQTFLVTLIIVNNDSGDLYPMVKVAASFQ